MPNNWTEEDSFYAFMHNLLGHENIYAGDSEGFAGADDYENLFHKMATMEDILGDFVIEESDEKWHIKLTINHHPVNFSMTRGTDWFNPQFVQHINLALRYYGFASGFYIFHDGRWGQQPGIVYLHDALGKSIDEILHRLNIRDHWGTLDNRIETHQQ